MYTLEGDDGHGSGFQIGQFLCVGLIVIKVVGYGSINIIRTGGKWFVVGCLIMNNYFICMYVLLLLDEYMKPRKLNVNI